MLFNVLKNFILVATVWLSIGILVFTSMVLIGTNGASPPTGDNTGNKTLLNLLIKWPIFVPVLLRALWHRRNPYEQMALDYERMQQERADGNARAQKILDGELPFRARWIATPKEKGTPRTFMRLDLYLDKVNQRVDGRVTHSITRYGGVNVALRVVSDNTERGVKGLLVIATGKSFRASTRLCNEDQEWRALCAPGKENAMLDNWGTSLLRKIGPSTNEEQFEEIIR